MEAIYSKYTEYTLPLKEEDLLDLALLLRTIGPNYNSVMLLHIAKIYLDLNRNASNLQTPSHTDIDINLLKDVLAKYERLNNLIEKAGLIDIHLLRAKIDGKAIQELY